MQNIATTLWKTLTQKQRFVCNDSILREQCAERLIDLIVGANMPHIVQAQAVQDVRTAAAYYIQGQ